MMLFTSNTTSSTTDKYALKEKRYPSLKGHIDIERIVDKYSFKTKKIMYDHKIRAGENRFKWNFYFYSKDGDFQRCWGMDDVGVFLEHHGLLQGFTKVEREELSGLKNQTKRKARISEMIIIKMVEKGTSLKDVFEYINK